MSKTTRRKNIRSPHRYSLVNIAKNQRRRYTHVRTGWPYRFSYDSYVAEWHFYGDGYEKSPLKKNIKWHSDWHRRSDERKFLSDVKKELEPKELSEKKYKGLWWVYD